MENFELENDMKCPLHANYDILYIQVQNIQENRSIFYCEVCVSSDFDFKPSNFVRVKQLQNFQSNDNSLIDFWPPTSNATLQKEFIQFNHNTNKQEQSSIQDQIVAYFEDLKKQVLLNLEESQKKATLESEQMFLKSEKIKETYHEISQISKLMSILSDNKTTVDEKEILYKEFLSQIQSQKQDYTKTLQSMLQEQKLKSEEEMNEQKQKILTNFEQLSFFQSAGQATDLIDKLEFIEEELFPDFNKIIVSRNTTNKEISFINAFNVKKQYGCKQYYSNLFFDRENKYVITFKVLPFVTYIKCGIQVGFIKDSAINKLEPDRLFMVTMSIMKKKMNIDKQSSLSKIIKGDFKDVECDVAEFQLTLEASKGSLEFTDLPQKKHIVVLNDLKSQQIKDHERLRMFISLLDDVKLTISSVQQL